MSDSPDEPETLQDRLLACAPGVYGLLLRMVGRREVAEDLMQETLLRAFRGLDAYRPEGKFRAWVFRIALNQARDWIRRQHRPAPVPAEAAPAAGAPPEGPALARERRRGVEQALARLAEDDREVLLMRYYGDMTFKEIARATDEPLGTVLARAHRALKKLGRLIPENSR